MNEQTSDTAVQPGLLVRFDAAHGKDERVTALLRDAGGLVQDEPGTLAWYGLRFGRHEFGIFDVFPDKGARFSHLAGHVPRELAKHATRLLGGMPDMHMLDVVAERVH